LAMHASHPYFRARQGHYQEECHINQKMVCLGSLNSSHHRLRCTAAGKFCRGRTLDPSDTLYPDHTEPRCSLPFEGTLRRCCLEEQRPKRFPHPSWLDMTAL